MTSLSIVVPFYGVEAYIAECLESLRVQTHTDFEVIMVDDGSPDNSREVAQRYADLDPRFKLVVQQNQGLGPARNTGTAHSSGKYLTFVDSDDIVAPRAYSLLVDTLDRTGSAFAGANARRFSSTAGTRQSWTHREAFAATRLGTNIREFPVLMMDRMVWNKVYRRSFWDAHGYEFPAIRYEDFPVTLKAHLDADAVDLHSEHIYYWRDRESGDSITQQVFKPGNARDRVQSAHMVLDVLADYGKLVPQEIVDRVHGIFIDVDLVALAGAIDQAPAEFQPELQQLALGLARRLQPQSSGRVARLARLIHKGLLHDDIELVAALSRWREGGGTKALVSDLAKHPRPYQFVPVMSAVTRRRKLPNPVRPRKLKSELVTCEVVGDDLHLRLAVTLRQQFAARVTGRVDLVAAGWKQRLDTKYRVAEGGLELDVVVPAAALAGKDDPVSTLEVTLALATLRWQGQVKLPPEAIPPVWQVAPDLAVQVSRRPGSWFVWFVPVADPVVITGLQATDTGFRFELNATDGELVVPLPYPTSDVVTPLTEGIAEIDITDLVRTDVPDNPVTLSAVRAVTYRAPVRDKRVRFRGTFESDNTGAAPVGDNALPGTDWEQLVRPLLATARQSIVVADSRVTVAPDGAGEATLVREPVGAHVSDVETETVAREDA